MAAFDRKRPVERTMSDTITHLNISQLTTTDYDVTAECNGNHSNTTNENHVKINAHPTLMSGSGENNHTGINTFDSPNHVQNNTGINTSQYHNHPQYSALYRGRSMSVCDGSALQEMRARSNTGSETWVTSMRRNVKAAKWIIMANVYEMVKGKPLSLVTLTVSYIVY